MGKKTTQLHTTLEHIDQIRDLIRSLRGTRVCWEKNRDRRKQQQTCVGVIEETYARHFSVKTSYGYTSFTYADLLVGDVVLEHADTSKDILDCVR